MLEQTPFHRENYSRLIIGVIVQYYQQCSARFKGSETPGCELMPELTNDTIPAAWAQREEVIAILSEVRSIAVGV
jgi:exocyst complex component 4